MHIHIYFMPPFIVWPRNNSNCWLWAFACLMHLINIKPCFGRECGRHSSPRKSPLCSIVFVGQPPPPPPKAPKRYKIQLQIHLCCCRCCCHIYIISFATHAGHFSTTPNARGKLLHAFINKNYARLLICNVIGVVVVLYPSAPESA